MSVAKRAWQGHIKKGGTEIGFVEGSFTVDRGLQIFHQLGSYDIVSRRETAREITGSIDKGWVDETLFGTEVTGASLTTFQIEASTSVGRYFLSGCSIESYDWNLPIDGWITESISFRAKTITK